MFMFNFDPERGVPQQQSAIQSAERPSSCDCDDKLVAFTPTDEATVGAALPRDVVRGEYEGGAQVWECTNDLLSILPSLPLCSARVLDLGCGAGLLGAAALRAGAARVVFSDLNRDVLEHVTARTVADSRDTTEVVGSGRDGGGGAGGDGGGGSSSAEALFVAGSWAALLAAARGDVARCSGRDGALVTSALQERFDVILSAETAYRPENCATLAALCAVLLASPGGVAFFATKRFYFGSELGGGTDALCAAVERTPGLTARRRHEFTDNVVRDIIQISRV